MLVKCLKALKGVICATVLAVMVIPGVGLTKTLAQNGQSEAFDELDAAEKKVQDQERIEKGSEGDASTKAAEDAPEKSENIQRKSPLPTIDKLVEAKLSALKLSLQEQDKALAEVATRLDKELAIEKTTFDQSAYLALSMINSAPSLDYRLDASEVYIDGKLMARGGKRHHGLPSREQIFFGPVPPGCHQLVVKAKYTRLKNDIMSRFKVNRIERIVARQAFIAKSGHRLDIEIQGMEQHNSLVNLYRGPAIRFNRSVKPNYLPGASIISMDDVLKQGRVRIEYQTEDQSTHRLIKKSLRLDGMPILVDETHSQLFNGNLVFDAPIKEGRHRLNVVLLFGEKKWVLGGPDYNFRLSFDRDFYVISGQKTLVNLTGMPKGGIRTNFENSRYARAQTIITPEENLDFFPLMSCQEITKQEQAAEKKAAQKALDEEKARVLREEKAKAQEQEDAAKKSTTPVEKSPGEDLPPAQPAPAQPASESPSAPQATPEEPSPPLPGILPQKLVPLESPPIIEKPRPEGPQSFRHDVIKMRVGLMSTTPAYWAQGA